MLNFWIAPKNGKDTAVCKKLDEVIDPLRRMSGYKNSEPIFVSGGGVSANRARLLLENQLLDAELPQEICRAARLARQMPT
jgi:hypothetical protein